MNKPTALRVVVDRREGNVIVLTDDHGDSFDVPSAQLPEPCRSEGAVLDVPLDASAQPRWREACPNDAEQKKRLKENRQTLEELKRRDPGGDVTL